MTIGIDRNVMTAPYGRETVTIRKLPCPRCPQCHHVEGVEFEIESEQKQLLTGAAAAVVWDMAQLINRRY